MNQKSLISEMSALERKVELLVSQQNNLRQELKQLREENGMLRSVIEEKDEQINHFQKTLKLSKIVDTAVAGQTDTTELKRTINEYIRKIDKCIAQLSQ
jgi:predicted  nucleic acid-binding Zn-ribbon protein